MARPNYVDALQHPRPSANGRGLPDLVRRNLLYRRSQNVRGATYPARESMPQSGHDFECLENKCVTGSRDVICRVMYDIYL
jgi:hypothetical protein